jgi:hypothetical protein
VLPPRFAYFERSHSICFFLAPQKAKKTTQERVRQPHLRQRSRAYSPAENEKAVKAGIRWHFNVMNGAERDSEIRALYRRSVPTNDPTEEWRNLRELVGQSQLSRNSLRMASLWLPLAEEGDSGILGTLSSAHHRPTLSRPAREGSVSPKSE